MARTQARAAIPPATRHALNCDMFQNESIVEINIWFKSAIYLSVTIVEMWSVPMFKLDFQNRLKR